MRALKPKYSATDALLGIWTIALTSFIVGTLYVASELLIPLALAVLLTFLLSPLGTRMERGIGRIAAVLVVAALIFTGLGGAGWMLTRQLVDLAAKLPECKGNIIAKMQAFETPKGGVFSRLSETVEELKKELPGGSATVAATVAPESVEPWRVVPSPPPPPAPMQVVANDDSTPIELLLLIVAPLLGPLGTAALVVVLGYLCLKLRSLLPRQKIVIGLWGATEDLTEAARRLRESGADQMITTLAEALEQVPKLAPPLIEEMMRVPIPADEEERLAALAALKLLDTEAEPVFDRITAKMARVFEMPIALITLVDRDRQFFKSQTGLPETLARARQTARNVSICGHVIAKNEVMVIEDLARDRRFANNPLLKEHGIRFYPGVPLLAPNGQSIGSLCLLDMKPRQLTEREKRLLQEYATEVMEELARRSPAVASAPSPMT